MEENKSSVGSIIGTIIIIGLIVLGGLYFWGKRIEEAKNIKNITSEEVTSTTTNQIVVDENALIKQTKNSDDLNSLQSDLDSTNTTNLSTELGASIQ